MSFYSTFKPETSANTQESEQHDLVNQDIETETTLYLAEENLAHKVEEAEVLSLWNSNKKYIHLARFPRRYLLVLTSSVYYERFFLEDGNLYKQKRNQLISKSGEKLLFIHHNLKNQ